MLGGAENRVRHTDACIFGDHHRCNFVIAAFTTRDGVSTTVCECWCHNITAQEIADIKDEIITVLRNRAQVELDRSRS